MINGVPGMTAAPGSRYPAIYVLYNTIVYLKGVQVPREGAIASG